MFYFQLISNLIIKSKTYKFLYIEYFSSILKKMDESLGTVTLINSNQGTRNKKFTFDKVFGPGSKQLDIFHKIALPIVHGILEGYNGLF